MSRRLRQAGSRMWLWAKAVSGHMHAHHRPWRFLAVPKSLIGSIELFLWSMFLGTKSESPCSARCFSSRSLSLLAPLVVYRHDGPRTDAAVVWWVLLSLGRLDMVASLFAIMSRCILGRVMSESRDSGPRLVQMGVVVGGTSSGNRADGLSPLRTLAPSAVP